MNKMPKTKENKNSYEQALKKRRNWRDNSALKEHGLKLVFKNYQSNYLLYYSSHAG